MQCLAFRLQLFGVPVLRLAGPSFVPQYRRPRPPCYHVSFAMSLVCAFCLVPDGEVEVGWCPSCSFAAHTKCLAGFVVRGKTVCPMCRGQINAQTIATGYEVGIPLLEELLGDHHLVSRLKLDMAGAYSECGRAAEALEMLMQLRSQDGLDKLTGEMLQAEYWRIKLRTGDDPDGTFHGVCAFLGDLRRATGDCPASRQVRLRASLVFAECCLQRGMPRAAARVLQSPLVDLHCGVHVVPLLNLLAGVLTSLGHLGKAKAARAHALRILEDHGAAETTLAAARMEYELSSALLQGHGWTPGLQLATRVLKRQRGDAHVVGELVSRAKAALPAAHSSKRLRWKTPVGCISALRCAQ